MSNVRKKLANKKSKLGIETERIEDHPANLTNYQDGSFYNVEINLIKPNPDQPRKHFDPVSLEELSKSIAEKGVLQPIIIRREADKIYLVAGERRLRSSKMAGLDKIPAILTTGNPAEISLIENLQRENLRPVEEAEALARMTEEYNYTHEKLAMAVGKARSTITETLRLNSLPEEIKEECRRADNYPRRLLVEVAKQDSQDKMRSLFAKIKKNNLKSGAVRTITRNGETKQTPGILALNKANQFYRSLSKLDLEIIEETERERLISRYQEIKELLGKFLN